jgi:hypothetical protein
LYGNVFQKELILVMTTNVLPSSLCLALLHTPPNMENTPTNMKMNYAVTNSYTSNTARRIFALLSLATFGLLGLATTSAQAQPIYDNFDSAAENPAAGWSHISSTNYPATYTFPTDLLVGHACRLQAGVPTTNGITARAVAVCTNQTYTDFYVATDLLNWNSSTDKSTNYQCIFLLGRASGIDSGLLTSWVLTFVANVNTETDRPSLGRVHIGCIFGGDPNTVAPSSFTYMTLVPGHSYRLVFQGVGNVFTGAVYDLQDLTRPLATLMGNDLMAQGIAPTSGYSGIGVLGLNQQSIADATFDNFVAASAPPPTSVTAPATPHGLLGAPQVFNRTPASWANFYNAAGGISFTATTLTTTNNLNTSALRLILNGVDVSSGLIITPSSPPTNANVSFSGLASNCVYDASIILQDSYNRWTTNVWNFDTFSAAYLAGTNCLNIECEDYDFGGGHYFDDPAASGYSTNDISYFPPYIYHNAAGFYASKIGVQGVDFFDYDGSPSYGAPTGFADPPCCEFRTIGYGSDGDPVGTEAGAVYVNYTWGTDVLYGRNYDTQRQKYIDLNNWARTNFSDPAIEVEEYVVVRTAGGEWLHYTRTFDSSKCYNVYLRHGCALSQQLNLYYGTTNELGTTNEVYSTTNKLGTFNAVNSLAFNYRYAPLLDASGKLAVVNLTNVNTLRLEVAPPSGRSIDNGLALNYLAFVPAMPQVYSCAQVKATYTPEVNFLVDAVNRRITLPAQTGATRYYRIGWTSETKITGYSRTGGNVVVTYEVVP